MGGAVVVAAVLCALPAASAAGQRADAVARWEVSLGGSLSAPAGWVQVRENQIEGTRLNLRHDLGVVRAHAVALGLGYHVSDATAVRLSLESNALDGRVLLPGDVIFNGTTLAAGTTLETRTHFPYFVRATVSADRRLLGIGRAGYLSGMAGLTFVMLTFQLHGTIAPASVGHETKEDFVTQELPVPALGLTLDYPFARHLYVRSSLDGGYLPWVNSLRHEGGEVRLTQRHVDFGVGLGYAVTPTLLAEGGYRYSDFVQRESSREDGNDIRLTEHGARLELVYRF